MGADRINRIDMIFCLPAGSRAVNKTSPVASEGNPVEREDIAHKEIDCAYQAPRSGCVFQTALPERPDAVDPSNPVR
jgi:hypothetical protein